jgi:hypothetical protein
MGFVTTPTIGTTLRSGCPGQPQMRQKQTTLDWLAEPRAGITVGCLLLAAAVALTMRTSSAEVPADLAQVIVPSDQIGQAILLSSSPPAIGALLLSERAERAR